MDEQMQAATETEKVENKWLDIRCIYVVQHADEKIYFSSVFESFLSILPWNQVKSWC